MATSTGTMAIFHLKCLHKPIITLPNHHLPKTMAPSFSKLFNLPKFSTFLRGKAIANLTTLTILNNSDMAIAAQKIAETAENDNRGLALLLPIIPAILWVLYNILGPALNQINRMRSKNGIIVGVGVGGLAASSIWCVPHASASTGVVVIGEGYISNEEWCLLLLLVCLLCNDLQLGLKC